MTGRWALLLATVMAASAGAPASASRHLDYVAELVVAYGDQVMNPDAEQPLTRYDPETGLVRDPAGNLNIAEDSLNYAAALLQRGVDPERAARVIGAVLEQQDRAEGSATRGLFRWLSRPGSGYDVNATLYVAPALAHLSRELAGPGGAAGDKLKDSATLALRALLSNPKKPDEGFSALMWAGAVCTLGDAAGDPAGPKAGAELIGRWLAQVSRLGISDGGSPTYDALRIGGLRWAWQFAADDVARGQAAEALELCYRDLLQRYDPDCAMVGGAVEAAYPADYTGDTGVARYLLACDLPSALAAISGADPQAAFSGAEPLAMYFALSAYEPAEDLLELAGDRAEPYEVRTRRPGVEDPTIEVGSTCTWVAPTGTLGTVSGPASLWSIPIMMTSDLPRRPASYFYLPDAGGVVQSLQSGPLALCSFSFDNVGVADRKQVRVRGVLGRAQDVDRVLVNGVEWIGEPEAIGQGTTVALQRGSSYFGLQVLQCGRLGGPPSDAKPGVLAGMGEGGARTVMLDVFGREADYALREPLQNVRVGLLVEMGAAADWESLEAFARHVSLWRVKQTVKAERRRAREQEENNPLNPDEPKSRSEMVFIVSTLHTIRITNEQMPLELVEDMSNRTVVSRKLPTELPPDYLWLSPALTVKMGQRISQALAAPGTP